MEATFCRMGVVCYGYRVPVGVKDGRKASSTETLQWSLNIRL